MIHHFYLLARMYAEGMVFMGFITAIIDHFLFRAGHITRRVTLRGCFVMGLLWPLFLLLLINIVWNLRKKL